MGESPRKSILLNCPYLAGVFEGWEALDCLQPSPVIVGADEIVEMYSQLGMVVGVARRECVVQLAFGGAHFGDVDMEVADGVCLELLLRFLVPRHFGQSADAVALQTAVQ